MFRFNVVVAVLVAVLVPSFAQAQSRCSKSNPLGTYTDLRPIYPPAKGNRCIDNYTPGTWTFQDPSKKIKIIVTGGSMSQMDYFAMGYGRWVARICKNVEVVNIAEVSCNSSDIQKKFQSRVLDNRNLDLDATGVEYWMMIQGGLNNVSNPNRVNKDFMELFRTVHSKGMKVVGLTLVPWGRPGKDKRWKGESAKKYQAWTRQCVDWMMGRLTPTEALGKLCPAGKTSFSRDELPDVAINLFDTPLLDKKSPYGNMRSDMTKDGIHPLSEGHRVIVEYACDKGLLPSSWGCDCSCARKPAEKKAQ